jgi:hypothetical protein
LQGEGIACHPNGQAFPPTDEPSLLSKGDLTMKRTLIAAAIATTVLLAGGSGIASSHREAPIITKHPKVDGTDFYMFRSYEAGREGFVTFIANYQPLQDPYGGPNYFLLDDRASYEINIDNDGDALADIVYEFEIANIYRNIAIPVGGTSVAVPLSNVGPFGNAELHDNQNVFEVYQLSVRGEGLARAQATNVRNSSDIFIKPFDNIGTKSIPDYPSYAERFVYRTRLPGCASEARVFVGQRREGFAVNLGEVFDLINTNPVGPANGEPNSLFDKNVTTFALEVPISCLTAAGGSPIIGAWTTARTPNPDGPDQVSRLSAPLVNEVVIGLPDKDKFNASMPKDDGQFAKYVTNPVLPELIEILFPSVQAPNLFPRTDLVAAFLTGVEGLNKPAGVVASEMMRLNTTTAAKPAAEQNNLGVIGGDTAGFPNGRRPGDDVVDIALRVSMGVLLTDAQAPSRSLPYTDGTTVNASYFRQTFPYLTHPLPGSPNDGVPTGSTF